MNQTMTCARVTGPIGYVHLGRPMHVPLGPCMIERIDGDRAEIIWGNDGEHHVAIPIDELIRARTGGTLVVLN